MHRPTLATLAALVALGLVTAGGAATSASSTTSAADRTAAVRRHHPAPSHFTHGRVDNRVVPAEAGRSLRLPWDRGPGTTRDVLIATYRTKVIDGVTCRVVFDRVWRNGILEERTRDFYAQTKRGTVWYFGENTATLDRHGHVISREGSFMSGRDGAEAGIFMTADPAPGAVVPPGGLSGPRRGRLHRRTARGPRGRPADQHPSRAAHPGDDRARTRRRRPQVLRPRHRHRAGADREGRNREPATRQPDAPPAALSDAVGPRLISRRRTAGGTPRSDRG